MTANTAEREGVRFTLVLWLAIFPALGVALFFVFSASYHPAAHAQPQPFSCASEMVGLSALDVGGQIAPLCGATPYPEVAS